MWALVVAVAVSLLRFHDHRSLGVAASAVRPRSGLLVKRQRQHQHGVHREKASRNTLQLDEDLLAEDDPKDLLDAADSPSGGILVDGEPQEAAGIDAGADVDLNVPDGADTTNLGLPSLPPALSENGQAAFDANALDNSWDSSLGPLPGDSSLPGDPVVDVSTDAAELSDLGSMGPLPGDASVSDDVALSGDAVSLALGDASKLELDDIAVSAPSVPLAPARQPTSASQKTTRIVSTTSTTTTTTIITTTIGAVAGSNGQQQNRTENVADRLSQAMVHKQKMEEQATKLEAEADRLHREAVEEVRKVEAGALQAARVAARSAASSELQKADELKDKAFKDVQSAKALGASEQAEMSQAVQEARSATQKTTAAA